MLLAIETSCDETAAALLTPEGEIAAEALLSQQDHAPFGGVVPEIAARAHLAHLPRLVRDVLDRAQTRPERLDAIAATAGPGLIGGLLVGANYAKGMAAALGKPFLAINHLEAHALTVRLPALRLGAEFPYLVLLVSGGHTQTIAVEALGHYRRLGTTIDDAAGEAFDKVAKLLGLPFPGGPALEALAGEGEATIPLPRPMLGRDSPDFSFSGLKTAVAGHVAGRGEGALPRRDAANLAASFQRAAAEVLADRTARALSLFPEATALVAAGGVAANHAIRAALERLARARGLPFLAPPLRYCGDNATMIAWAALERFHAGHTDPLDTPCRPRWPLDEISLAK